MLSEVKRDLRVQNSTLIFGERGWCRQGKGISISTMQKGAILWKCVKTFVPHCSLIVRSEFTVFALFYFVFEGNFPSTSPWGAYIWEGDLKRVFALPDWGTYTWRGLFSEFDGI